MNPGPANPRGGSGEDDEQEILRRRLGLDDDEICPTVDCFAYVESILPRRGYFEIEDGVIGVYDRKGEIITALPADFDPYAPIPCETCGREVVPMDMRCETCTERIDPSWVWSYWYGEEGEEGTDFDDGGQVEGRGEGEAEGEGLEALWDDQTPRVRLASIGDPADARDLVGLLEEARIPHRIVNAVNEGLETVDIWIEEVDLGRAQNAIARPGVEG